MGVVGLCFILGSSIFSLGEPRASLVTLRQRPSGLVCPKVICFQTDFGLSEHWRNHWYHLSHYRNLENIFFFVQFQFPHQQRAASAWYKQAQLLQQRLQWNMLEVSNFPLLSDTINDIFVWLFSHNLLPTVPKTLECTIIGPLSYTWMVRRWLRVVHIIRETTGEGLVGPPHRERRCGAAILLRPLHTSKSLGESVRVCVGGGVKISMLSSASEARRRFQVDQSLDQHFWLTNLTAASSEHTFTQMLSAFFLLCVLHVHLCLASSREPMKLFLVPVVETC